MATFSQSTIDKGSDIFQDFLCSPCEDKLLHNTADFYCESCVKFYCGNCIYMHSQLFTTHYPFGRGDIKTWPVAKRVEDVLLKCDVHKEENLELFCDQHNELCCEKCAFLNHRECLKVTPLSDIVKSQSTDLQKLLVSLQTILEEMKKLQNNQESSMRYVQSSYDEQLHTIQETRKKINAALNTIEQKTLKKMKDTLTKMQASSKSDVNKCIRLRDELKHLRDALEDISDKSSKELSFIATRKCEEKIQKCQTFLREISLQFKVSITFQPNSEILRYLSKLSGLGVIERSAQNQNKLFTVHGTSVQNVGISSDNSTCYITNILILLDGQVLLADSIKKKIKLLDQQYQVVSQWSVITWPLDMCQVTPNEVAVAVAVDDYKTNEVQFITVDNRQLVTGRKLQLEHRCYGIACHHEDLYITANTALYKYTLSGKLVNKMYEDTSDRFTVGVCAVSPMGDKLYITNRSQNKLITLARDGSVLAVFIDPALKGQLGIHVTPAGQVLVCGSLSSTIVQMDSEGNRKLATLLPRKDILVFPRSVCYNSFTASIMVGLREDNKILVLKVK